MTLSTKRFDYTLRSRKTGAEHGLMVDYTATDQSPFQLVVREQTPPSSMNAPTDDELYSGRDLTDAWRIFFTKFTGGNGQIDRDVPGGSDAKFYESHAIDVSRPGDMTLQRSLEMVTIGQSVLSSLVIEAEGKVVFGCLEGATSRVGWIADDGAIEYAVEGTGLDAWPTDAPLTAMASDGEFIYAAFSGASNWGIWRGNTDAVAWQKWNDLSGIEAMQYCGGIMYAVQNSVPGYISFSGTFANLEVDAIHTPDLDTFGFTSIGNWAYWGTTAGGRTYVYALQHNIVEGDRFEHYVELPNGFIGTTMHGYLGNLYIAGYYMTNRTTTEGEGVGQGAVYMATEQGIARLCNIGDDPNEKPVGSNDLTDDFNNRVRVIYGYGSWLYVASDRSIYRWDIDSGGLAHVVDVANFSIDAGEVVIDPEEPATWDPNYALHDFTGWWANKTWGDPNFLEAYQRSEADMIHGVTDNDLVVHVDTGDRYGYKRHCHFSVQPDTLPAITFRIKTTTLRQEALEFGARVDGKMANIQVYARESDDKFRIGIMRTSPPVYTEDWPISWEWSGWFENRNGNHEFYLTHDGTYVNLWLRTYDNDDVVTSTTLVFRNVTACYMNDSNNLIWFGCGWGFEGEVDHPKDWWTQICEIDVDPTNAVGLGYVPGAAMIPNMTVVNGVPYAPYVPQAPSTDDDGFIALDMGSYASDGWLETSWKSASMPTVKKHFTAIDLFYAPLSAGATITVSIYSDGGEGGQTLEETFTIPPDTSDVTLDYVAGSAACTKALDFYARRVKLRFEFTGGGVISPSLRGACLRFGPLATKIYQMLTVFRDNVRDYDQVDYNYLDAYEFIMAAADSGEVLELRAAGLDVLAKVTAIQFLKAKTSRQHSYEPQGAALVQFQRVE